MKQQLFSIIKKKPQNEQQQKKYSRIDFEIRVMECSSLQACFAQHHPHADSFRKLI